MNRLRVTKVREVYGPTRSNAGDAGLDFYTPTNLRYAELLKANENAENIVVNSTTSGIGMVGVDIEPETSFVKAIHMGPHSRILIPSGIRVLLEPKDSMLMAANKSGISTKKGLVYTAEVVDTPYLGEIHIGLANTAATTTRIEFSQKSKVVQFVHVPIMLTEPEFISNEEYEAAAKEWDTTRGTKGLGSGDNEK